MSRPKPVRITTPFPSIDDTARKLGVSRKRTKELVKLAAKIRSRLRAAGHGLKHRAINRARAR